MSSLTLCEMDPGVSCNIGNPQQTDLKHKSWEMLFAQHFYFFQSSNHFEILHITATPCKFSYEPNNPYKWSLSLTLRRVLDGFRTLQQPQGTHNPFVMKLHLGQHMADNMLKNLAAIPVLMIEVDHWNLLAITSSHRNIFHGQDVE